MGDGGGADDDLDRVSATMDAEVRAEQAVYELMALQAEWRSRRLSDVAGELLVRGDEVEVVVARQRITGTVRHAGEDFAVIAAAQGPVDVALAATDVMRVTRRVRDGGHPPGPGARTLRARLTEHEVAATPVRVLTAGGEEVDGVVLAVATDHVLMGTRRGHVVVPWAAVAAVWLASR